MEQKLVEKLRGLYSEYKEFEVIVKEKNKKITDKNTSLKDLIVGKTEEELESILIHVYVDTLLYNKDLQMMFAKLIHTIELHIAISDTELEADILTFYNDYKEWMPKRVFAIEKGDFVETETGLLEKARKEFLGGDFYKGIVEKAQSKA